jgi:5-methyltetrahydrofolate--homocysteine methyltransferase
MTQDLITAIIDLQEPRALELAREMILADDDPWEILDACREAMVVIGNKFERGESFIPELVFAGEILDQITQQVKPILDDEIPREKDGKVVFGTVAGDIHDIAKDIVVLMLDINGFEVYDLGVDVSPQIFIDKIQEVGANILGLSGFLTLAFDPMKKTIDLLQEKGLGGNVRVMIGGGPVDDHACRYTGADAWGKDAMAAVELAKEWNRENNSKDN